MSLAALAFACSDARDVSSIEPEPSDPTLPTPPPSGGLPADDTSPGERADLDPAAIDAMADGLDVSAHLPFFAVPAPNEDVLISMSDGVRLAASLSYLEDVAPDGRVTYLSEGALRLLHRATRGRRAIRRRAPSAASPTPTRRLRCPANACASKSRSRTSPPGAPAAITSGCRWREQTPAVLDADRRTGDLERVRRWLRRVDAASAHAAGCQRALAPRPPRGVESEHCSKAIRVRIRQRLGVSQKRSLEEPISKRRCHGPVSGTPASSF